MKNYSLVIVLISFSMFSTSLWATERYVVKGNAGASSPYTSWATAAANIQDAIDACSANDTVIVSNGIYNTGSTIGVPSASYTLKTRLAVNKAITLRAFSADPADTIIEGAADPDTGSLGTNATRCVYLVSGSVLSGFTIRNGFTKGAGASGVDDSGGGILVNTWSDKSTAIITNCIIENCTAYEYGGGAYGAATYKNCQICGCSVNFFGGGIYGTPGTATLVSCVVSNNSANSRAGGATLVDASSCTFANNSSANGGGCRARTGTYENCIFRNNVASNIGGGASLENAVLRDCLFVGNHAVYGGAIAGYESGSYTGIINHCTFSNNVASSYGGGLWKGSFGSIWATNNCLFVTNNALQGGAVYLRDGVLIKSADIRGNSASSAGGGVYINAGGIISDCNITDNSTANKGGGIYIDGGGRVIDSSIIGNQSTNNSGGGVYMLNGIISNCVVSANSAKVKAGGVYINEGLIIDSLIASNVCFTATGGGVNMGKGVMRNCLIVANEALGTPDQGGGGVFTSSDCIIDSCTVVRNKTAWKGGGIYGFAGATTNTIIAYNSATAGYNDLREALSSTFNYCCSPDLINGTDNNITSLPSFVNIGSGAGTNAVLGDYHLTGSSPCINAGINISWMVDATDFYGNPRIANGTVDIGCHEYITKGTVIVLK